MLFAAILIASTIAAGEPEVPPGTPIVAIRVVRQDIFDTADPGTSAWPYRWANALHVLTRERFVRSLLLFKVGDKLDPARLAESERILRGTGFLTPVHITAHPAPGGAEVLVETHDQWTTLVGVSFGIFGKRKHSGASLSERNFLGWGKELEFEVSSDPERTTTALKYKDPLFLDTRWQLRLEHRNASDGKTDGFQLTYPFFALNTPRAGGISWRQDSMKDYLYSGGNQTVSGDVERHSILVWGGLRLPGDGLHTNRLTLGAFSSEATYAGWRRVDGGPFPAPEDRHMKGVQVGWDHQADRWVVVRGFRGWQAQEDLALGPNWGVDLGFSLPVFGGDRRRLPFDGNFSVSWLSGRRYSWVNVSTAGRLEEGGSANTVTHLDAGSARIGPEGLRGRISLDLGRRLDLDQQLTLGADTGLRGWDPDTFDGTSRAVANFEWRKQLTGEVLHLGIIGMTLFADAGKTWNPRVGPSTEGWRKDAGAGLLVESTRASSLNVIRIEAAWPDRGKGPLILVSGQSLF